MQTEQCCFRLTDHPLSRKYFPEGVAGRMNAMDTKLFLNGELLGFLLRQQVGVTNRLRFFLTYCFRRWI